MSFKTEFINDIATLKYCIQNASAVLSVLFDDKNTQPNHRTRLLKIAADYIQFAELRAGELFDILKIPTQGRL